jgi:hypothetical protein
LNQHKSEYIFRLKKKSFLKKRHFFKHIKPFWLSQTPILKLQNIVMACSLP